MVETRRADGERWLSARPHWAQTLSPSLSIEHILHRCFVMSLATAMCARLPGAPEEISPPR
eukprot:15440895-Alexandrium_andersonii.AAC.1